MSTKFHPNPSTTFWDILLYIGFALSFNGEESWKKLSDPDPDRHQNWINSSFWHTQHVHQVLYKSINNFFRYRAIYRFWPYLSMVKNHLKILVVGSGSSPKSNQFVLVTHPTCPQLFEISCAQTNKQTDKNGSLTYFWVIFAKYRAMHDVSFVCLSVCLSVCRISQKVVDGSGWNFVERLCVWQGQNDLMLVKIRIRIWIWIRELFNF